MSDRFERIDTPLRTVGPCDAGSVDEAAVDASNCSRIKAVHELIDRYGAADSPALLDGVGESL